MNKYLLFICVAACIWLPAGNILGQTAATEDIYVKYNAYYENLGKWLAESKSDLAGMTLNKIKSDAALLKADEATDLPVAIFSNNTQLLSEEMIFSKRKNGVLIIGKLSSTDPGNSKSTNFDLVGTAFAISADGTCVTNFHVLKNIIRPDAEEGKKDSVYFIITNDKKVYFINKVMAFSKNNDLAIFKVDMPEDSLHPIPFGKPANIGATVYCISHPLGHFYSFSKGIVARNASIDPATLGAAYDKNGRAPIRMEITADYAIGSSGGPILDRYGNLIGVVISTTPISYTGKDVMGNDISFVQMMVKETAPVKALTELLKK
jgi:serine protease Do